MKAKNELRKMQRFALNKSKMKKLILILLFTPLILISQDGLVTTHNKSGEIVSEYNYKDDKLHGWFKRYDGSLIEEEGSYKYGERHGLNKTYYTYGDYAIMSETNFRNGYEEGERRTISYNVEVIWDDDFSENPTPSKVKLI